MTEIPEDIMKAAQKIADDENVCGAWHESEHVEIIAKALLAERQRCAEIARTWVDDPYVGSDIAEAIMEGGEA